MGGGAGVAGRAGNRRGARRLGRLGLAARALLFAVSGVIALRIAIPGGGGGGAGGQGAIAELAQQPYGKVLVALLALGFVAYVVWQVVEVAVGYEDEDGGELWLHRAASAGRALAYAALAVLAVKQLTGSPSSGSGGTGITAKLLELPGGQLVVAGVGVAIAAVGIVQGWRAIHSDLHEEFRGDLSPSTQRFTVGAARTGLVARMVAFGLVGGFVVHAALTFDPEEAQGLDAALQQTAQTPWGTALVALVGIGFMAFATYCGVLVRYGDLSEVDG